MSFSEIEGIDGELSWRDIMSFVPDVPVDVLVERLSVDKNTAGIPIYASPSEKLDAVLQDPNLQIPYWMRCRRHRKLAEKVVSYPLWDGAGTKKYFPLKRMRNHFGSIEPTKAKMINQHHERFGKYPDL